MSNPFPNRARRVVHYRFGDPQEVLRLEDSPPPAVLGAGEVRVRVIRSMIHPGDLQLVAAKFSQTRADIPAGRVPGLEAVGTVEAIGPDAPQGTGIEVGSRVAFLAQGAWQSEVAVPASSLTAIPDDISDDVATQILVNSVTARHVLRTALSSLSRPPAHVVLTAAGSAVGKLIFEHARRDGLRLIRLIRSADAAARLERLSPGGDIVSTAVPNWHDAVREAANGDVPLVIDGVGGPMIAEIGQLLNVGGVVASYGLLDGGPADLTLFVSKGLTLRGVTLGAWNDETTPVQRAKDLGIAIDVARSKPELFGDIQAFDLTDLTAAIAAVSAPSKHGNVILKL